MNKADTVKAQIVAAFAAVEYPGDWCVRGSNEGDEPYLLEQEFKGKTDWRTLDAEFIDQAPGGFGSALSFFSDEAFHFYLPAYMIADVDGRLEHAEPVFHLCLGLDDASQNKKINPRRYGERTWLDEAKHKFSMFNDAEAKAIAAYLRFIGERDGFNQHLIGQALKNYWLERAG
jgi:hypothetical protein